LHPAELTVCCRLIRFSWHRAGCPREISRFPTVSLPDAQTKRGADVDFQAGWAHVSNQEHQVSPRGASDWWRESRRKSLSTKTKFGDQQYLELLENYPWYHPCEQLLTLFIVSSRTRSEMPSFDLGLGFLASEANWSNSSLSYSCSGHTQSENFSQSTLCKTRSLACKITGGSSQPIV